MTLTDDVNKNRRLAYLLTLAAITAIGTIIRIIDLGRSSLWYDELYTVWASKLPLASLVPEVIASGHPPAYYTVLHFWLPFGSGDDWVRMISAFAGIAAIILTCLLGSELFSRRAALWGAAFVAVSPLLVSFSRDATLYSWIVAFSLLSLYLLARSLNRGGWQNWVAYVAVTTTLFFSYFFSAFLFLAGFAVYWFLRGRDRSRLYPWAVSQAILLLALAVSLTGKMALDRAGKGVSAHFSFPDAGDLVYGLAAAPYVLLGGREGAVITNEGGLNGAAVGTMLLLGLFVVAVVAGIAFSGTLRQLLKGNMTALAACCLLLTVLPVVVVASVERFPMAYRYYMWAAPVFLLLIAALVAAAPRRVGIIIGVALIAGLSILTYREYSDYRNYDMRKVMEYIAGEWREGDMLICFPHHHCAAAVGHYLPEGVTVGGGLTCCGASPDSAFIMPPGEVWSGYLSHYGPVLAGSGEDAERLSGPALEEGLDEVVGGAGRVWFLAGTGGVRDYPPADVVYRAMGRKWGEGLQWRVEPFLIKLYVPLEVLKEEDPEAASQIIY